MRASLESMPPGVPMCRYLVYREAEFLGAGMSLRPYWFADPHLFEVFTAPEDGPHMGERFASTLGALESVVVGLGAQRVRTMISSVRPEIAEVLRSDGYVETDRSPVTMAKLDPAAPPAPPTPEAVAATGIHIQPLSWWIERTGADWKRQYWEYDMVLTHDIPFDEEWQDMPFESYCKLQIDTEHFDPDLQFVAMDGDEVVGMTMLFPSLVESDLLNTGLTGVKRYWRRRGIARVLKQHALAEAFKRGGRRVVTENSEVNPMLTLNLELGYRPVYDQIVYTKVL